MNDGGAVDRVVGALTDPFGTLYGHHRRKRRRKWKISRAQQDELAVESHRRAIMQSKGLLQEQILPIELKTRKKHWSTRIAPRADRASRAWRSCARCSKDGSITAGNASESASAAAVVLMEKAPPLSTARNHGIIVSLLAVSIETCA
jgi:acetyl-CoA C-acetyltransferase